MAHCFVCDKPEEEVVLFDGITEFGIKKVCFRCSERDGITLIKKPTQEQLEQAEKRRSVREVMEQMSSPQRKLMIKDQAIAHKSLAKLHFPEVKQEHGDLVQNYDWILKQARRHAKMSTAKLAQLAGIERAQYEALESGRLFVNFQSIAAAVERVLEVKILKVPKKEIRVLHHESKKAEEQKIKERSILDSVKENMKRHFALVRKSKEEGVDYYDGETETQHDEIDVDEIIQQKNEEKKKRYQKLATELESDKFDFSRRENLDKITLNDLAELKRLRQEKEELDDE